MDHIVYLDSSAKELQKILSGEKTMIIRASMGKARPYGKVDEGDTLFFVNISSPWRVKAMADVRDVHNSEKMTAEESVELIKEHQEQLGLSKEEKARYNGKRYVILIGIENVRSIVPFSISDSIHGGLDDWLVVDSIDEVIT